MNVDTRELGKRVREAREAAGVSQDEAREVIGVSQPTYSRIESGDRLLKGDELIQLADRFHVRAAAITGLAEVRERVRFAARTDGDSSPFPGLVHAHERLLPPGTATAAKRRVLAGEVQGPCR